MVGDTFGLGVLDWLTTDMLSKYVQGVYAFFQNHKLSCIKEYLCRAKTKA